MLAAFSYAMDGYSVPNWVAPWLSSIASSVAAWTVTTVRQHDLYKAVARHYATQSNNPIGKVAAITALEFLRVEISSRRTNTRVAKLKKNAHKERIKVRKLGKRVDTLTSDVVDIRNVLMREGPYRRVAQISSSPESAQESTQLVRKRLRQRDVSKSPVKSSPEAARKSSPHDSHSGPAAKMNGVFNSLSYIVLTPVVNSLSYASLQCHLRNCLTRVQCRPNIAAPWKVPWKVR